jgi:hypothetical protein
MFDKLVGVKVIWAICQIVVIYMLDFAIYFGATDYVI